MSEGIKELRECLVGLQELSLCLVPLLKDGVQPGDAVALWAKLQADPVLLAKLTDAVKGLQSVPAELKDMDLLEGMELVKLSVDFVPRLISALKGQ